MIALVLVATLKFQVSGQDVAELTLPQLQEKAPPYKATFFDPHYGKQMTYDCLPMAKVMEAAYGPRWRDLPQSEVVLTAMDGYASVAKADKLAEPGGCLAFAEKWEPIGRKKADPAPFYLAWSGDSQTAANEYPWPWQLYSVNLVTFEERFPEVVARGAAPGSPEHRGYMVFRGQCLRCHSINQQGGKVGPDLNAPRSIVTYRPKKQLLQFIRKPSDFRYSEMPDHPHLTQRDLDDLWAYFTLKSKQPEKGGW